MTEIRAAGFAVEGRRIVVETISGSIVALQRPGFVRLLDRLEAEDVLVVTKLDRLGRKPSLTPAQQAEVRDRLAQGESVSALARASHVSRLTIARIRERAERQSLDEAAIETAPEPASPRATGAPRPDPAD